ncbi:hypothetical protein ABT299_06255 [Spirillospora sp. NPDC000708]|uniref:ApeI family dehydratase n=1 Tax=Actinomadura nitritigenes TaxID=134602 RepID=UPI00334C5EA8
MTPDVASPVVAVPVAGETRASVTVDPAETVFAGHYPGQPILPGVCVVEYVRLATAPPGWRLADIESSRFLRPVLPADRLTIEWTWSDEGPDRRCSATVSTERGVTARVRIRFVREDAT